MKTETVAVVTSPPPSATLTSRAYDGVVSRSSDAPTFTVTAPVLEANAKLPPPSAEKIICDTVKTFFIHWTFYFVFFFGRAIHKFQIPTTHLFTVHSYIACNLKSTNSNVHIKVHCHQTTKFRAQEIK